MDNITCYMPYANANTFYTLVYIVNKRIGQIIYVTDISNIFVRLGSTNSINLSPVLNQEELHRNDQWQSGINSGVVLMVNEKLWCVKLGPPISGINSGVVLIVKKRWCVTLGPTISGINSGMVLIVKKKTLVCKSGSCNKWY